MPTIRTALAVALLPALLAGCVASTTPTGSGSGGTEQLRASQTTALRRAGVSDDCIQRLPLSTLTQVKGITSQSARTSKELLQQRQRIRTAAEKVCGTI